MIVTDEVAKLELEHLIGLYKFYLDAYIKGVAFFLAIISFLVKAALDDQVHRQFLGTAGMATCIAVLIFVVFAIWQEKGFARQFRGLSKRLATDPISTVPFRMLFVGVCALWLITFLAWIYILRDSR